MSAATLLAFVGLNAQAGAFECRDVDPESQGHQAVHQELTLKVGVSPVEFAYCDHDRSPRWRARWDPLEAEQHSGQSWRRYVTARCWDRADGHVCRTTDHVVVGSSHVVVDIKNCTVGIAAIAQISAAVAVQYPGHEMKEIEYTEVRDGGAWSAERYGYNVMLNEPPEYKGGSVVKFVNTCVDGDCAWRGDATTATWIGGSLTLPRLRRERGKPLIDHIVP